MILSTGKTGGSLANTALSSAGGVLILSDQVYPPNQPPQSPSERCYSLPQTEFKNLLHQLFTEINTSLIHRGKVSETLPLGALPLLVCAALQCHTTACIQLQSHHTSSLTEQPTTGFDLPKALLGILTSSKYYVKKSTHQKECFLPATRGYLLRRSHRAIKVTSDNDRSYHKRICLSFCTPQCQTSCNLTKAVNRISFLS